MASGAMKQPAVLGRIVEAAEVQKIEKALSGLIEQPLAADRNRDNLAPLASSRTRISSIEAYLPVPTKRRPDRCGSATDSGAERCGLDLNLHGHQPLSHKRHDLNPVVRGEGVLSC